MSTGIRRHDQPGLRRGPHGPGEPPRRRHLRLLDEAKVHRDARRLHFIRCGRAALAGVGLRRGAGLRGATHPRELRLPLHVQQPEVCLVARGLRLVLRGTRALPVCRPRWRARGLLLGKELQVGGDARLEARGFHVVITVLPVGGRPVALMAQGRGRSARRGCLERPPWSLLPPGRAALRRGSRSSRRSRRVVGPPRRGHGGGDRRVRLDLDDLVLLEAEVARPEAGVGSRAGLGLAIRGRGSALLVPFRGLLGVAVARATVRLGRAGVTI
mmetsp:Transcript_120698/g.341963  ORF Transcript_120698/g.341963 Transcript_120698/m.341963 type:complete len:271 (+) Transcript_120698:251-1063(+)